MPEHEIQPELELFEQVGQQDNIYLSHHCLKARLALAHKGAECCWLRPTHSQVQYN